MFDYDYVHLFKDYEDYLKRFESLKDKSELTKLDDYLRENYGYIHDMLVNEGYEYNDEYFLLFNEILFEGRVIGFFSVNYDATNDFVIISDVYVMPNLRRNGLFTIELINFYKYFRQYHHVCFLDPNEVLIKSLLKHGFAIEFDEFVASYFYLVSKVYDGEKLIYRFSSYYYKKKKGLISLAINDDFDAVEIICDDFDDAKGNYIATSTNYTVNDFKKFKKICHEINDEVDQFYERMYNIADMIKYQHSLVYKLYLYDDNLNTNNLFYQSQVSKYFTNRYHALSIEDMIKSKLEVGEITVDSFSRRLAYLFNFNSTNKSYELYDYPEYDVCPFCRTKYDNDVYCNTCGFVREFTEVFVEFIKDSGLYPSDDTYYDLKLKGIRPDLVSEEELVHCLKVIPDDPICEANIRNSYYMNQDALKFLEYYGYIRESDNDEDYMKALHLVNMKTLKSILKFNNLKVTGSKDELIDRISSNADLFVVKRFLPYKVYEVTLKGEEFLAKKE